MPLAAATPMTFTTLVLLGMFVAVFAIAARVWWTIHLAERRDRERGASGDPRAPRSWPPDRS